MNSDVSSKSLKLSEAKPMKGDARPKSLKIGRHGQKMPQYVPSRRKKRFNWDALVFLLPKGILFCGFVVVPFVYTFVLMFQVGTILRGFHFVGLENFQTVLTDALFFQTLLHTGMYMLVVIPLTLVIPMAVGLLFSSMIPGIRYYRGLIYIPSLLSVVSTSIIWKILIDPGAGLLDKIFNVWLGWHIPWLSNPTVAIIFIAIVSLWNSLGFYSIIFMAGFNDIPKELFEAAQIDGANAWNVFWRVKLPLMQNVIQLVLVLVTINSIQVFDVIFVMTSGGPGTSTYTVMWYIYQNVFSNGSVGYAATMGVVILLITLAMTIIFMRTTGSEVYHV
jgi:ABC-type sugar transport system permease subunit